MKQQVQSLEFQLKHTKLAALGFGDPTKPMILAVHGWLDNAESFRALAEVLPDYYLLAIDLAGHGLSEHRSPDAHYHLVDFVDDIHQLVSQQKWPPFIVFGHSLGGIVASLFASAFPEMVSQLVTIESLGPFTASPKGSAQQLQKSILSRSRIKLSLNKPVRSLESAIKARALAGGFDEKLAKLLMLRNLRQQDGDWVFNSDKRLRTFSSLRMTEPQAEAFLRNIACPVLVITGSQGYPLVAKSVKARLPWLAKGHHVQCEGHHHLHMDNPQQVADCIHQFLAYSKA